MSMAEDVLELILNDTLYNLSSKESKNNESEKEVWAIITNSYLKFLYFPKP
jgi:hypothetical protein